eukprot:INCI7199.2.p1 GENE.INCI7199.2~~INCI7199.2.p1  ORF type:complete len:934 (-),score=146.71 INCI7199.2:719-3520(-)
MAHRAVVAATVVASSAIYAQAKWPLHTQAAGDDVTDVPADFDCAMRQAAYAFGKETLPRLGAFESLYYALDLNDPACPPTELKADGPVPPRSSLRFSDIPAGSVFVAPTGGADEAKAPGAGTAKRPFATIQFAVDTCADRNECSSVVLRGGTHYLDATIVLTPRHSHMHLMAFPGESPVVSGGTKLEVDWKPYPAPAPAPSTDGYVVTQGDNAVWGGKIDNTTYFLLGKLDSAQECLLAANASGFDVWTYHDTTVEPVYRKQCWATTKAYSAHAEGGHTSGHRSSDGVFNPFVANVKGQIEDAPGLQLNGVRATRARFPNQPGGVEVSPGYNGMIPGGSATWTPPDLNKYGPVQFYTDEIPEDRRNTTDNWFNNYMIGINGLCSVYDPPVSYWCSEHPSGGGAFAFRTPQGVTPHEGSLPNSPYADVSQAVFFVWRPSRWANWMFELSDYDPKANNFSFGHGGFQGARGNNEGGDFFVENVFEEWDYPGEFFYNRSTGDLFLSYNGTGAPPADMEVVVPRLQSLINITGTQWDPVQNVSHSGIEYRAAAYTYMNPHGVPSAGDWALDRIGAVFLEGTEDVKFDNCTFERLDGNAVMVSGYNRRATVSNSDFAYIGGNAVAAWGYTNETEGEGHPTAGVDGTDGNHPQFTTVTGCSAREVGLYEKQSSFFIQAKTALSRVQGNVFFNGPRAGINANDGFGGGDLIQRNLVFSTCRESGDHGPFNSWDRQPFKTLIKNGNPSMIMQWREISHNFFIDNYSPQEDVDNDDGSCYYLTHNNFLVYGGRGMKNDFGGHDNRHYNNVYGYVGQAVALTGVIDGHEDHVFNNYVVMTGTDVGGLTCSGTGKTFIRNNSYFTSTGDVTECKSSLHEWQKHGNDPESSVGELPDSKTIIARGLATIHAADPVCRPSECVDQGRNSRTGCFLLYAGSRESSCY